MHNITKSKGALLLLDTVSPYNYFKTYTDKSSPFDILIQDSTYFAGTDDSSITFITVLNEEVWKKLRPILFGIGSGC